MAKFEPSHPSAAACILPKRSTCFYTPQSGGTNRRGRVIPVVGAAVLGPQPGLLACKLGPGCLRYRGLLLPVTAVMHHLGGPWPARSPYLNGIAQPGGFSNRAGLFQAEFVLQFCCPRSRLNACAGRSAKTFLVDAQSCRSSCDVRLHAENARATDQAVGTPWPRHRFTALCRRLSCRG